MGKGIGIHWVLGVLAFPCAGLALAQGVGQGKVYAGGAIGLGAYKAGFERTNEIIRSTGATAFSSTANSTDTMWSGYLGYRFSPNVSVEGGYWNFGEVKLTTNVSAPVVTSFQRKYSADGFGARAVLWLPVGSNWAGIVNAGALQTKAKASASDPGAGLSALPAESSRNVNMLLGIGVEYRLTPGASARLGYEYVRNVGDDAKFGTSDINLLSIGGNYRF